MRVYPEGRGSYADAIRGLDLFRPDPAECALNQHLIELAIWFYAELKEKRPAVLAELQRSLAAAQAQQS